MNTATRIFTGMLIGLAALLALTASCVDRNEGDSYGHSRQALTVTRTIDFDYTPAGAAIAHNEPVDEQYAVWGVHSDGVFFIGNRLFAMPDFQTNTSLNLICTAVGASGFLNCRSPLHSYSSKLVFDFDMPVDFVSIEGVTRADGVYDADGLFITAYDAFGTNLGTASALNNNNPWPWTTEGVLVASIARPGIRRVVIDPHDTDGLDNLVIQYPDDGDGGTDAGDGGTDGGDGGTDGGDGGIDPPPAQLTCGIHPGTINLGSNGRHLSVTCCDIPAGSSVDPTTTKVTDEFDKVHALDLNAPHGPTGNGCYHFKFDRQGFSASIIAGKGWTAGNGERADTKLTISTSLVPSGTPVGVDTVHVINN
jgi:hypothetical protein